MSDLRLLDVDVDYHDSIPGIMEVIKQVKPEWSTSDIEIELLSGGSLNTLYRLRHVSDTECKDAYVARVQTNVGETIDRRMEPAYLQIGHHQKCCAPVHALFKGGLLVGYSQGDIVTWEECYDDKIARHMVNLIADLNAADVSKMNVVDAEGNTVSFKREPCVIPRMKRSLTFMPKTFVNYPERQARFQKVAPPVATLKADIVRLELMMSELNLPVTFAHNDVWVNNYVYNRKEDSMNFIDFEYAGFNYEGYDLGAFFSNFPIQRQVDKLYKPNEVPKPDLPLPASMKIRWCRWYLQRRLGEENVTLERLTTFYNQTRIYDITNQLYWAVLIFTMCDNERAFINFLEFGVIRYSHYLTRRDELFSIRLDDPLPSSD